MRTTPGRKVKARTQNSLLIRKVEIQSRLKINLSNNLKMKSEGSVRKGKVKTLLRQPMLIKNRRKILFKILDRKSTRLNSSHVRISYAVFCLKKKKQQQIE